MNREKDKPGKTPSRQDVIFSFNAPAARTVKVLGDFNDWDGNKGVMRRNQKGIWKKTIAIEPGIYQYKFLIDGHWTNDPECEKTVLNIYGTDNNVVSIASG